LHTDSYIHRELCQMSKYTCFTELVGDVRIEVADKSSKKVDMKVHVEKDTVEMCHLEASNKQAPYKFGFRSPYVIPFFKYMKGQSWLTWLLPVVKSPFDVEIDFHPIEKSLRIDANIDTNKNVFEIVSLGGERFDVLFNSEVLVQFVASDKTFELQRTLKDGRPLKTIVNWNSNDLLQNTAAVTVVYKDIPQVARFGWNLRNLAQGMVNIDIVGKKVPMLGDFELARNINWNVVNSNQFEMSWDGKASTNMMDVLSTPILTDAKLTYSTGDVDVVVKEMFNAKTFSLIFSTRPFKFALLPFFEF